MLARGWVAALILLAVAAAAEESKPTIAEVQVVGGATISAETVEYYLGISEGDEFDPQAISANFHRFWESGLVEDARVESEQIEPGRVRVIVTVKERPKVSSFDFEGNKKLSESTLKEKLDEQSISLKRNVPLRTSELARIRRALLDIYSKEGYASATVEARIEDSGKNQRRVVFDIDEGAKVKIGDIDIVGNEVYSDWRLKLAMKKVKERSLFRLFGKKIIWNKESWGEDAENLKKFYLNRGYKNVVIGEPQVDLVARNPEGETQKQKKFSMQVTIPVEEGERYRMGSLTITGATVFDEERLSSLYEVEEGGWLKYARIEEGNEGVRTLYQSRGYIYSYTSPVLTDREGEENVADVEINIYEGDRYKLGRLEFAGNTKTQEKVLRREFRLAEGDWMNMTTFRRSVFKVNQLGYFKLTEDPLEFDFDEPNKEVDVLIKGQEVGRSDIQFGAGYSELDGFFVQGMFNTRNFLGRGESFGISVSSGKRADNYSLSFTEPYFLDRRMVIGGSIYRTTLDLKSTINPYERESKGGSIVYGLGVGDFGQLSFVYGFEDVYAKYSISRYGRPGDPPTPHRPPIPIPIPEPDPDELYLVEYNGITSSFTPAYYLDSRDDPFDPNSGASLFGRLRYAGGLLGGDFYYWRPEIGASIFHPLRRRIVLAANFEAGMIRPFGGKQIPVYDRYYLGGERSLRGFGIQQVLPRTSDGEYYYSQSGIRLGGDRYLQLNLEYQIKLGGPIKFILFGDVGNAWHEEQGWDLGLMRYSTGAELRIFLPIFQAPLRFIYGINLDPFPNEKSSDFQFSIGTTF